MHRPALATDPEVLLLDEPASALDPTSTARIEDLIFELKSDYTIVIVTHNMQQAARVSDLTAFFGVECERRGSMHNGMCLVGGVGSPHKRGPVHWGVADSAAGEGAGLRLGTGR